MLDWLTGSTNIVDSSDEERTCPDDDGPATPAPLFALRAFQHAIYGTPKPGAKTSKPSRKPRPNAPNVKFSRPENAFQDENKNRPKTASQILNSPSKPPGILLTPGTGGNRRKTVSFGSYADRQRDREATNSLLPTTPKDVPGRFPTPRQPVDMHAKQLGAHKSSSSGEHGIKSESEKGEADTKETEQDLDRTLDMKRPHSSSGQYWKSEFDSFSTRSSIEMRKLIKKEQLAKKYAKHRDSEALKLADLLRKEQQKVAHLEERVSNYIQQLKSAVNGHTTDDSFAGKTVEAIACTEEVSELKSALRLANAKAKTCEEEMKSMQSSSEKMLKEAKLLEQENKRLREDLARIKRAASPSPKNPPQLALSSDIWADVGNHPSSEKIRPYKSSTINSRSPLRPRATNTLPMNEAQISLSQDHVSAGEDWKEVARKRIEGSSSMPTSRREAALKRIEERRNNRRMTNK